MEWTAQKIRQRFLEFFKEKGHQIVSSAPMVIKNDPTLMFTNAGMNQFKDIFLGYSDPENTRLTDTQKCLRVSGKHNDLEEVGVDTYHHTMFEMLGNWSFGDYFKEETIAWAWELLTKEFGVDKDRIYVTVFGGDKEDKLGEDKEARDHWKEWIDEDRILSCDKRDNFWEMGDMGPCGPCSEIHIDLRSEAERKETDGKSLVNMDHPQVVEVWNLVFMQYNRKADRSLEPLPARHVDTGMGFERIAMVLQGKTSNYDTDVFSPIIEVIEKVTGKKYGRTDSKSDVAIRVISDHLRAISFSIADGQLPSNTGAGYVIRRILRRADRYAFSFLDYPNAILYQLVPVLVKEMGESFPELKAQESLIVKVIREEEESFLRTLDKGMVLIEKLINKYSGSLVDGKEVFTLYDRYGFPADLTSLILKEKGKSFDQKDFDAEMERQKSESRNDSAKEMGDWVQLDNRKASDFVGYDQLEANVKISRYRKLTEKGKDFFQLVLDITPFYPEGGGQVGDTGILQKGDDKIHVLDTKKENNLILLRVNALPKNLEGQWKAVVSGTRREDVIRNHTATHLLHQALREVLGPHVQQKGSLVHPNYLRFDFSHFSKVSAEEIRQVENLVNERIRKNFALNEKRDFPFEEAKALGAMALFGEKYGNEVRVIQFGDSVELCGGCHVKATGHIGLFKITTESANAAGVRRIEAITSRKAEEYLETELDHLDAVRSLLKNPADLGKAIRDLLGKNQELTKALEKVQKEKAGSLKDDLLKNAVVINGVRFIGERVGLEPGMIRNVAFELKGQEENLVLVLATVHKDKPNLTVMVTDDLVKSETFNAGAIIREIAGEIKGGGGGQAFFATAGGKDASGIDRAIKKASELLA